MWDRMVEGGVGKLAHLREVYAGYDELGMLL
jgi:hypothetical protein